MAECFWFAEGFDSSSAVWICFEFFVQAKSELENPHLEDLIYVLEGNKAVIYDKSITSVCFTILYKHLNALYCCLPPSIQAWVAYLATTIVFKPIIGIGISYRHTHGGLCIIIECIAILAYQAFLFHLGIDWNCFLVDWPWNSKRVNDAYNQI